MFRPAQRAWLVPMLKSSIGRSQRTLGSKAMSSKALKKEQEQVAKELKQQQKRQDTRFLAVLVVCVGTFTSCFGMALGNWMASGDKKRLRAYDDVCDRRCSCE